MESPTSGVNCIECVFVYVRHSVNTIALVVDRRSSWSTSICLVDWQSPVGNMTEIGTFAMWLDRFKASGIELMPFLVRCKPFFSIFSPVPLLSLFGKDYNQAKLHTPIFSGHPKISFVNVFTLRDEIIKNIFFLDDQNYIHAICTHYPFRNYTGDPFACSSMQFSKWMWLVNDEDRRRNWRIWTKNLIFSCANTTKLLSKRNTYWRRC